MEHKGDPMCTIERFIRCGCKRYTGFTLIELMIVVAIIGIIAAISSVLFNTFTEKARVQKTIAEIASIQTKIKIYEVHEGSLPDSLADIGNFIDTWGNAYQYIKIKDVSKPKCRKDRNLHPLNSDYDLWSNGKDGEYKLPLTAKASHDDIIRANDGTYIGIASEY